MVFVFAEELLYILHGEAGGRQGDDFGCHDLRDGDTECVFFFVVEEREAAEPDHAVCDAALAEKLADCFGDADYDHGGEDVS